jgi:hypothetical protein
MKSLLLVFQLALATSVLAQGNNKPAAPALPGSTSPTEKVALVQAASLLSKGQFDQATLQLGALSPASTTRVWVDWTPVHRTLRAGYKDAIQKALHNWNEALGGSLSFSPATKEDEADLLILFDRSVAELKFGQPHLLSSDVQLEPTGSHRMGAIRIALAVPNTVTPVGAAAVERQAARGLGLYLGLAPSLTDSTGVMGPESPVQPPASASAAPTKPSTAEIRDAKQLVDARVKLADFAKRKVAIYLPRAKMSIEKTQVDAGDVWRGDNAHFVFKIKNTGDAPLEIEAKPNCGCTLANYDKVIAPNAEGKIEAELHTGNFRGRVTKTIDVKSNDFDSPSLNLQLLANIKSIVTVSPSETPVIGLKTGEPTLQELEIKIDSADPVQVTRVACSANYVTSKIEPMQAAGAGSAYKVTLTIDPSAPMGRSAFVVSAFTSSKREPQVNITAICEKGIIVMPPSAYLGAIGPQVQLPLNQFLTVSRRDGSMHIQKIENDDPNLQVTQTTVKDGQQYQLHLTYKGGWPAGIVQRKIVVLTDDPAQPRIEIPVTANVLAAAAAPVAGGK